MHFQNPMHVLNYSIVSGLCVIEWMVYVAIWLTVLSRYATVVYCKRGYFRWGKISRKCWHGISRGGNFHDTTHIPFIKAYGFYFRVGVIFAKKTKARKTRKLPPRENFHVYSNRTLQFPKTFRLKMNVVFRCLVTQMCVNYYFYTTWM